MMASRGQQQQRMIGDYIVTQQIGAGAFAVVWKARHKLSGNEVAIKEIATEKLNFKLQQSLLLEIEIMKRTHHPNIIRLYDIVEASKQGRIFLIMEYCIGGDLAGYIQRHGRVSEAFARHLMRQLGAGLQVLRANNLIHRDLKPQNLLLSTNDRNAVLKIADFGFARSLQPQGMAETLSGSPLYMAPEILQRQKYDAKADLWSVGTILYQLLTGKPPFSGSNHVQFPESLLHELHPDCVDIIRKLLCRNPVERLSFEEFFNHNFMSPLGLQATKASPRQITSQPSDLADNNHEECFPFSLDDESHSPAEGQSLVAVKPLFFSTYPTNSLEMQRGAPAKFSVGTAPPATRGIRSRNSRVGSGFVHEEKAKVFGFGTIHSFTNYEK